MGGFGIFPGAQNKRDYLLIPFEEIRIKLNKKEEEILENTENILQDNIQELNTYSRIIQSKIIGLNKIVDSIQSRMIRKDELRILLNTAAEYLKTKGLTDEEILYVVKMMKDDAVFHRSYGEISGSMITAYKKLIPNFFEEYCIPSDKVKEIDNSIIPTGKYTYKREIGGEMIEKVMYGKLPR